jgi:uncharacterized protein (TIGR02001 family)
MKKFLLSATALIMSISVAKADNFTINLDSGLHGGVSVMTDYVQRGQSQTFGQRFSPRLGHSSIAQWYPAVSANASYTLGSGFFAGVNAINSNQTNNSFEGDLTVGYKTKLTDSWSYQGSVNYQMYPGASNFGNAGVVEFMNVVNYTKNWGKLVGAFGVQPQGQFHAGFATYTSVGADVNLPHNFVAGARVGYSTYSNHKVKPNAVDWTATVVNNITQNVSVGIQYTNSTDYYSLGMGQRVVGLVNVSF